MKLLKPILICGVMSLAISTLLLAPISSQAGEAELKAEIDRLWSKVSQMGGGEAGGEGGGWTDRVTISGVVEVEAGVADTATTTESDIAVATVELGVEAAISDFSSASILFLYEDGGTVDLDEATITIGNTEKMPVYLTAGKMYVPFGNYESQMISDPITLDIGEAQEDALLIGVEVEGFYGSTYLYNGDTEDGGDDEIEHYGINGGFAMEQDAFSLDVGAGWISSIRDSDGLFDGTATYPNDYVGGYAVHAIVGFGPVTFISEYVAASDDIMATGTEVSAFNVEAGISFPIGGKEGAVALAYQSTDEAVTILDEERILVSFGMELMEGTALAFEWVTAEDYSVADGGTGAEIDTYTLQLAAEF